ncbi:MAG: RecA-family ATPase [Psychroserpens sp.]|jgi:RecA-family ATPase
MNEQLELFDLETPQKKSLSSKAKAIFNNVKTKAKEVLGYGTASPIKFGEFKNIKGVDRHMLFGKYFKTSDIVEIAGVQGGGKSYLLYRIIKAMCTGGDFLEQSCPIPKKVVLLDGELPIDDVNERFDNILVNSSDDEQTLFDENFSIINREFSGGLMNDLCKLRPTDELFKDLLKFDVVVIDSLKTNTFGSNISSADEIAQLLEMFLLLKSHGITVIYVNHFTKGSVILGSVDFDIINDVTISFAKDEKKGCGVRKLEIVKGRGLKDEDKQPVYFTFHPDEQGTPFRKI